MLGQCEQPELFCREVLGDNEDRIARVLITLEKGCPEGMASILEIGDELQTGYELRWPISILLRLVVCPWFYCFLLVQILSFICFVSMIFCSELRNSGGGIFVMTRQSGQLWQQYAAKFIGKRNALFGGAYLHDNAEKLHRNAMTEVMPLVCCATNQWEDHKTISCDRTGDRASLV
jgi:hypothetical protein